MSDVYYRLGYRFHSCKCLLTYKLHRLLALWSLSAKMHQVFSSGSIHHQSVAAAALLTLPPAQVMWLLWERLCHLQASCLALEAARLLAIAFRLYELLSLSNNWARLHIYGCWKTQSQLEVLNAMSKKDFQLRGNGTVNTGMERGMGVRIWGLPRSWQVQLFCNWSFLSFLLPSFLAN